MKNASNVTQQLTGQTRGSAVQVAMVKPVVTANAGNQLAANATTLTIAGSGFDPIAANNTVVFNDGAVGTVTAATTASLTVTFSTSPAAAGKARWSACSSA